MMNICSLFIIVHVSCTKLKDERGSAMHPAIWEGELLDQALHALKETTGIDAKIVKREADVGVHGTGNYQVDALIDIDAAKDKHRFAAQSKQVVRAEILTQLRARWPKKPRFPLMVITPYMTADLAEKCREMELFFIDAAGNAYLRDHHLFVYVTGRKQTVKPAQLEAHRRTTTAGLRILFTILCRPDLLNAPYRELAGAAGVALGTVGPVIKNLEAAKHVATFGTVRTMRRLIDAERLVAEWVTFYPAALRPKLNPRRFRVPDRERMQHTNLLPYAAYWGGEMAADRLTGNLKAEHLTIYTRQNPLKLIAEFKLRADLNGDVEILNAFWDPKIIAEEGDLVPPLLAYADLMATTDGRNLEAAKVIYERYIVPHLRTQ